MAVLAITTGQWLLRGTRSHNYGILPGESMILWDIMGLYML